MWRELDDVISWVIKNERSVVRTTKSSSQTKWAENRRRLGIIWPIEAEVNAHAPTSTQQRECEKGAKRNHQRVSKLLIFAL
jgi:hypothetical protein